MKTLNVISSQLKTIERENLISSDEAVAPRRPRKEAKQRGRPRGSKNKQKEVTTSSSALVNDETMDSESSFMIRRRLQQHSRPSSSVQNQENISSRSRPIIQNSSKVVLRFHRTSTVWDSVEIPNTTEVTITPPPQLPPSPQRPIIPVLRYPPPLSDSDEESTSPIPHPRMPAKVACKKQKCNHQVIFGDHFNKKAYKEFQIKEQAYRKRKYGN